MSHFYKHDIFNRFMKIEEAAALWDIAVPTVKKYCQAGKIDATKIGPTWIIDKLQPRPILGRMTRIPELKTFTDTCRACGHITEQIAIDPDDPKGKYICMECYTVAEEPAELPE